MKDLIKEIIEIYTDRDDLIAHVVVVIDSTIVFTVLSVIHHLVIY